MRLSWNFTREIGGGVLLDCTLDLRQWMLGFNAYGREPSTRWLFNLFLGPIRIGLWESVDKPYAWPPLFPLVRVRK